MKNGNVLSRYYQNRYQKHYKHPKKLFVFDIFLILVILAFGSSSIYWLTYTPEIQGEIKLSLQIKNDSGDERILSGQRITGTIQIENTSETPLEDVLLRMHATPGLILHKIQGDTLISEQMEGIELPNIAPGTQVNLNIEGTYLQSPKMTSKIISRLNYQTKKEPWIHTSVGSIVMQTPSSIYDTQTSFRAPLIVPTQSVLPFTIDTNEYEAPSDLVVQIADQLKEFSFSSTTQNLELRIKQGTPLSFSIYATPQATTSTTDFDLSLYAQSGEFAYLQDSKKFVFDVLRPDVRLIPTLETTQLSPGETLKLQIKLQNKSNFTFKNNQLTIPLSTDIIDTSRLSYLVNQGNIAIPLPEELAPEEDLSINVLLPIKYFPTGETDLRKRLQTIFSGEIDDTGSRFQTDRVSASFKIGTRLSAQTRLVYYTDSGDQIGRGVVPFTSGKENKLWLVSKISNGTSKTKNVRANFILPPGILATGATSVSNGPDVTINANQVVWQKENLQAFEGSTVAFEISFTSLGGLQTLLQSLTLSAKDMYLEKDIQSTYGSLGASKIHYDETLQSKL